MIATPALAETYHFVIVPKAMNNPFFDGVRDGCMKRAKELGASIVLAGRESGRYQPILK